MGRSLAGGVSWAGVDFRRVEDISKWHSVQTCFIFHFLETLPGGQIGRVVPAFTHVENTFHTPAAAAAAQTEIPERNRSAVRA